MGFYLQISGTKVWLGGGAYFLDKFGTQAVRQHIQDELDDFQSRVSNKEFIKKENIEI